MDLIKQLIDLVLHFDQEHLSLLVANYHTWIYAILFLIIFCETGLVVTPFLPGDSLLFAIGTLAAKPENNLDVLWLFALLSLAALCGDNVNYWIGYTVGPKVFRGEGSRLLNKKHLERTHQFYEKHGGKTIIIARFMPIIRTFAPFVAGIGRMNYARFLSYSIAGAVLWMSLLLGAGYVFGKNEFVSKHFSVVVLVIVFISLLPGLIEFLRHRAEQRKAVVSGQ